MSLDVQRAILAALESGRAGVVATVLRHWGSAPGKQDHKMLVFADGSSVGTIGGGVLEVEVLKRCREALASGTGGAAQFTINETGDNAIGGVCGGRVEVAIEVLPEVPRVLLWGGGHCGLEVAKLLTQLGYLYEVHDPRPEYVATERFPAAVARHCGESEDLVATLGDLARFSHVLLVSRGHVTDRAYGRDLARAGYTGAVGMIGSRKKATEVRRSWLEEDGLDPEWVDAVACPVGVPIGARTPSEIAVSIVAWVVQVARVGPGA